MEATGTWHITFIAIIVFVAVFFLWALADVLRRTFTNSRQKALWLGIIVLIPLLGSVIYLIEGRPIDFRG